jgi:hypothetical protein
MSLKAHMSGINIGKCMKMQAFGLSASTWWCMRRNHTIARRSSWKLTTTMFCRVYHFILLDITLHYFTLLYITLLYPDSLLMPNHTRQWWTWSFPPSGHPRLPKAHQSRGARAPCFEHTPKHFLGAQKNMAYMNHWLPRPSKHLKTSTSICSMYICTNL